MDCMSGGEGRGRGKGRGKGSFGGRGGDERKGGPRFRRVCVINL